MQGKTVVITGATSGIGQVAAAKLAERGARIVFVARDPARGEALLRHLNAIAPGIPHAAYYADLSRLSEMKRVAGEIAAAEPKIDVLINNAGAMFTPRQLTADGLEQTFALNHMSYFVLTNLLLENLKAAGKARIVSTASDAHRGGKFDFADLQSEQRYRAFVVYARSKLMNILFTRELARRLQGTAVTANCLHPGFVATRFGDNNTGLLKTVFGFAKNFALSPEKGARTLLYLATSPEVDGVSGKYFDKSRPTTPSKEAQDDAAAAKLWQVSAEISGVGA
ncbi:MAG: SDR family oxidoreductase [Alphaproteobacteria bacterium]|nr:SDR family oxidoreductase [Alphaproteobacteria bacterium]